MNSLSDSDYCQCQFVWVWYAGLAEQWLALLSQAWQFGMAMTALNTSVKLLYVEPGYYWDGYPSLDEQTTSACNQLPWPTQPPALSGMEKSTD